MPELCERCCCNPCKCCIVGPTGPTGPTGPAGTGSTPVYGGLYTLNIFPVDLTIDRVIIPMEHATFLSGTGYDGSSLVIEETGIYIVSFTTHVISEVDVILNLAASTTNGVPLVGGQIVQRAKLLAGVDTVVEATFYTLVPAGLSNLVAWSNTPATMVFSEGRIFFYKIDDF